MHLIMRPCIPVGGEGQWESMKWICSVQALYSVTLDELDILMHEDLTQSGYTPSAFFDMHFSLLATNAHIL